METLDNRLLLVGAEACIISGKALQLLEKEFAGSHSKRMQTIDDLDTSIQLLETWNRESNRDCTQYTSQNRYAWRRRHLETYTLLAHDMELAATHIAAVADVLFEKREMAADVEYYTQLYRLLNAAGTLLERAHCKSRSVQEMP